MIESIDFLVEGYIGIKSYKRNDFLNILNDNK